VLHDSLSARIGSGERIKADAMRFVSLVIACSAEVSRDACGLVLLREGNVIRLQPATGSSQTARIAEVIRARSEALQVLPAGNDQGSVAQIVQALGRDTVTLIITDGSDELLEQLVTRVRARHAVVVVRVRDRYEGHELLPCGMRTSSAQGAAGAALFSSNERAIFSAKIQEWYAVQDRLLKKLGVPVFDLRADMDYDHIIRELLQRGV